MIDLLVQNYWTIIKCAKTVSIAAAVNNYCEYSSKTCIDFVDQVESARNKLQRLKDNGIYLEIVKRINCDERIIKSARLQFIANAIDAHNRNDESECVIDWDIYSTISLTNDGLLDHYIESFNEEYTNYDKYKQYKQLFDCKVFKTTVNEQVNAALPILVEICTNLEPDIDTDELCDEYEEVIREIYLQNENVRQIDYYKLWSDKLKDVAFIATYGNLYSLIYFVWVIIYSNATAERMVHFANTVRSIKRNSLCMVMLDCILMIMNNGYALSECEPLIKHGIDVWSKIGGMSAISEFTAKLVPNCVQQLDDYYKAIHQSKSKEYEMRRNRRHQKYNNNKSMMDLYLRND